ncbi:MAG TPA: MFS transporter [Streptosporangiaceae bacterium]|nr:MFS transporter [Streptosporangiaceae bacterium]
MTDANTGEINYCSKSSSSENTPAAVNQASKRNPQGAAPEPTARPAARAGAGGAAEASAAEAGSAEAGAAEAGGAAGAGRPEGTAAEPADRQAEQPGAGSPAGEGGRWARRLRLLAGERNFRIFYAGYSTSLLGTAMSRIALTFAVLDSGGTAADLGYVFAATVFPQVLLMIGGGVLADRIGRRPLMLVTDAGRLAVQATLAAALFAGRPSLWLFLSLTATESVGEGFFNPALGGLRADMVPADKLPDANAMLGVARSATTIAGPALAGLLVAVTSPAVAIAIDAASYGASVAALAVLRIPAASRPAQSPWRDLADSWTVFRSQTWLWVTTLQYALFNLFTWAPYLLLGPILARHYLGGSGGRGGASAWGLISAAFAAGAVLAGLVMVGRRPRRPVVIAALGMFGYPIPCLLLALHAPAYAVAAGALAAGAGGTIGGTLTASLQQQRVPHQMLARISAIELTGSYALGSAGWVLIGPLAGVVGAVPLLAFAAAYGAASAAVVLAVPAIWSVTWTQS